VTLAEHAMVPVSPGKNLELTLPLEGEPPVGPMIVEVITDRGTQRTAVVLDKGR
jgi:hypothetical protein